MSNTSKIQTKSLSLRLAECLSKTVNDEWQSGAFLEKVSPITADLLRFWFDENYVLQRGVNFHKGQKQAILNTVYCREILKTKSVLDIYAGVSQISQETLADDSLIYELQKSKTLFPKYCIKMATGTGKTWVLNALLIWQYLNAKFNQNSDIKWTKNFLVIAPGLIVYERLLDAFLGKEKDDGGRDFNKSDIKNAESLFIPEKYRDIFYSFLQNSVVEKQEIGKKTAGEGIIAVSNWHLFANSDEEAKEDVFVFEKSPFEDTQAMAKEILPISPGISAGHSLDVLDGRYFNGGQLEFLSSLPDICVFNDEAHHIHEIKKSGEVSEVEWQKALNEISKDKKDNFMQIDFSATPYNVDGAGGNRTKHYFPHIIVDFDLKTAMYEGLVKSIALDKRKEMSGLEDSNIDFKAIRDGRAVISLSEGQRIMIRAGLSKLQILEDSFSKPPFSKPPKMMIVCEDTSVSPLVIDFLKLEGLSDEDIMQIDSDKKGNVPQKQWIEIKQKLFNIDRLSKPKVIVSVLMLREGFDVNNIAVIVSLRSNQAPILLEQVLGRGLRQMWREAEYAEIKAENRENLYKKKIDPKSSHDILYLIEHPAFEKFYEDLDKEMIVEDRDSRNNPAGDIISVGLKDNYKDYDLFFPLILQDKIEFIKEPQMLNFMGKKFQHYDLADLKKLTPAGNDTAFISQEITVKTTFGEYKVKNDPFTASTYNEFLQRMLYTVESNIKGKNNFPILQINEAYLMEYIDSFIRTTLFGEPFDPLEGNNWRILALSKTGLLQHILRETSEAVYKMQNDIDIENAKVEKLWFSQIKEMKIREEYSLDIIKSIYEKTGYPSNKGGFEKDFLEYADADGKVERIIKINENAHTFAKILYIRTDGNLARYYPDFMLKIGGEIYIVETKSQKDKDDPNVKQKRKSALDFVYKINELDADGRMDCQWRYVLLDDGVFYAMKNGTAASMKEILSRAILSPVLADGKLL